jgi:hypothetical protein
MGKVLIVEENSITSNLVWDIITYQAPFIPFLLEEKCGSRDSMVENFGYNFYKLERIIHEIKIRGD